MAVRTEVPIGRAVAMHNFALVLAATTTGVAIVLAARWGPDWPAQQFRALNAAHDGLLAWTNQWYGGEALPGYSVLYPVFAAVLGAGGTGVVAVAGGAWSAGLILPSRTGWPRVWYSLAVVSSLGASLLIGQIPFLLASAFAAGAFVAFRAEHRAGSAVLAAASSLASPLAGLFLLMLGVSYASRRPRESWPFMAASSGLIVAGVAGGAGGPFPCPWSSLVGVWLFSGGVLACTTKEDWCLRRFAWLYAAAAILAFAVPNPIGGNITRLGRLIALPLLCYVILHRRRLLVRRISVCAVGGLVWALVPLISSVAHGAEDPSRSASYYSGLLAFLKTQQGSAGRLEVPFTREHWESTYVAAQFPLARGWERQSDLAYNSVLYGPLTASRYRAWLDTSAVDLIALPSVPLDYGGQAEAALLTRPPAYLVSVWRDPHWQVWRVRDPTPIATGQAQVTDLDSSSVTMHFAVPGDELIRIHSSRLWSVSAGHGCIATSPEGWLIVRAPAAGAVTIDARLGTQLLEGRPDCDS